MAGFTDAEEAHSWKPKEDEDVFCNLRPCLLFLLLLFGELSRLFWFNMKLLASLAAASLAFASVDAGSFYDNPEQDPLPSGKNPTIEELEAKWGFEV